MATTSMTMMMAIVSIPHDHSSICPHSRTHPLFPCVSLPHPRLKSSPELFALPRTLPCPALLAMPPPSVTLAFFLLALAADGKVCAGLVGRGVVNLAKSTDAGSGLPGSGVGASVPLALPSSLPNSSVAAPGHSGSASKDWGVSTVENCCFRATAGSGVWLPPSCSDWGLDLPAILGVTTLG